MPKQHGFSYPQSWREALEGPADASATLSLLPMQGGPVPGGPLQKTRSDAFNEGEAAEWLLRLG